MESPFGGLMKTYTVRSGDCLSTIAGKLNVSLGKLEAANHQIKNPNLIYAGEKLHVPGKATHHAPSHPAPKPGHHGSPSPKPTHHGSPSPKPTHHGSPSGGGGSHNGLIKGGDFSHYQSDATFNHAIKGMKWA